MGMTKEEFVNRFKKDMAKKAINKKYQDRMKEKQESINIADRYKIESVKRKRGY